MRTVAPLFVIAAACAGPGLDTSVLNDEPRRAAPKQGNITPAATDPDVDAVELIAPSGKTGPTGPSATTGPVAVTGVLPPPGPSGTTGPDCETSDDCDDPGKEVCNDAYVCEPATKWALTTYTFSGGSGAGTILYEENACYFCNASYWPKFGYASLTYQQGNGYKLYQLYVPKNAAETMPLGANLSKPHEIPYVAVNVADEPSLPAIYKDTYEPDADPGTLVIYDADFSFGGTIHGSIDAYFVGNKGGSLHVESEFFMTLPN